MKRLFYMFLVVMLLTISLSSVYAEEEPISLPKIGTLSGLDGSIQSADFSHDDKYIVVGLSNGKIAVWNSKDGSIEVQWQATDAERGVEKVIYNDDSSRIISSDNSATIKVWDVATNKLLHTLDASNGGENKENIYDIAVNKDSSILYTANQNRNSVIFWSMSSGKNLKEITFENKPQSLVYNEVTDEIAVSIENEGLNIYDGSDGSYILAHANKNLNRNAKYTSDYKKLFIPSSYNSKSGQPFILDVDKGYEITTLDKNDYKRPTSNGYVDLKWDYFDISPNDRYTAVIDNGVCIIDNKTKEIFTELDIKTNGPLEFNNSGSRLLAGNTLVDTSLLPNVVLTGLEIEIESTDMNLDEVQNILLKELFSDGTFKYLELSLADFNSSNPKVATMLYGKLNSKEKGTSTITASYKGFTDKVIINVEKHKAFGKKVEVETDKEWTINFNMDVNLNTIGKDNIRITNKNGEIIPVIINTTGKMMKIKSINDYISGESYTIWIRNLESKSGIKLKENTKMDFKVK